MVVRQRDAHAWVEAWLDGVGWTTVEATPASGTPDAFEKDHPIGTFQKIRERISDFFGLIGDFFRALKWQHIAMAGAALTLIAILIQALRTLRLRRSRPRLRAYEFPDEQYRQLAQQFEAMLRKLGGDPPASATWSEHLRDQSAQYTRSGKQARLAAAARFVDAYNKRRFGHPDDPHALAELRQILEELGSAASAPAGAADSSPGRKPCGSGAANAQSPGRGHTGRCDTGSKQTTTKP
jgi:hypothetical protein